MIKTLLSFLICLMAASSQVWAQGVGSPPLYQAGGGSGGGGGVTCAGCTTNVLPKTTGVGTLGNSVFKDTAGVPSFSSLLSGGTLIATMANSGAVNARNSLLLTYDADNTWGMELSPSVGASGEPYLALGGYGSGDFPFITLQNTRGAVGAEIALQSGDRISQIDFQGWNGSAGSYGATLFVDAAENFDLSHTAASVTIQTIDTVSESLHDRIKIDGSGDTNILNGGLVLATPSGGSQGLGTVNAQFGYYTNGGTLISDGGSVGAFNIQGADVSGANAGNWIMTSGAVTAGDGSGGNITIGTGGGHGTGHRGDLSLGGRDSLLQADRNLTLRPNVTAGGGRVSVDSGALLVGLAGSLTASEGELAGAKITASGTAPGAGFAKMAWAAGTNAGTCKLISYAGTSTTPVVVVDNVGAGC